MSTPGLSSSGASARSTWHVTLRKTLESYFDEAELETLCFDLLVDYESLAGETKTQRVVDLVRTFARTGRIEELIDYCSRVRPNVPWAELRQAAASNPLVVDTHPDEMRLAPRTREPEPLPQQPSRRRWPAILVVAVLVVSAAVLWTVLRRDTVEPPTTSVSPTAPARVTSAALPPGPGSAPPGSAPPGSKPPATTPILRPAGTVPFNAPDSPKVLNPELAWYPGGSGGSGSAGNAYSLDAKNNVLTLTAGPNTMNWGDAQTAPMMLYRVSGDFSAQVRVECDPSLVSSYTGFGFGVRSASDHTTWLQLARSHALFATKNESGATKHLNTTPYGGSAVYLKIERVGTKVTLSTSQNGASWTKLSAGDFSNLPAEVDVYLFTFASEAPPLAAQFSDLRVLH